MALTIPAKEYAGAELWRMMGWRMILVWFVERIGVEDPPLECRSAVPNDPQTRILSANL